MTECKAFTDRSIGAKTAGGDVIFYAKIGPKLTHRFKNADFQSFARSASALTPSKKNFD